MKRMIGIDLGTTNTVAAFMDGNEPRIIPNDRGGHLTPSVVALTDTGELLVGDAAKNQAVINANGTVMSVKREMGSRKYITLHGKKFTPQEISAHILKKVKHDCEHYLGYEVRDAVISVPAYFNEPQRRDTREAGRLAGFHVHRIINEPTAASLAYASQIEQKKNILVYDIGGGTFDATVLSSDGHSFNVLSTSGNNKLGGIDFDELLYRQVVKEFSRQSGLEIDRDPILRQQLLEQVERAKIELSSRDTASITLPFIAGNRKPLHLNYTVEKKAFNNLIRPYIEKTVEMCREAIRDAGGVIDSLIFSGGSSRIPLIGTMMEELLRLSPVVKINPDEVVALGVAVQTDLLQHTRGNMNLHDVTALPLGVEIQGGTFLTLLERNTPLPAEHRRLFTTVSDQQELVEVHVLQGLNRSAEKNTSLGKFKLSGIQRTRKGNPRIELLFRVNEDGILRVIARDLDTGVEEDVTIKATGNEVKDQSVFQLREHIENRIQRINSMIVSNQMKGKGSFIGATETIIAAAGTLSASEDKDLLQRHLIALDAVLAELNDIMEDQELQYGRA